jgi:hypothetical protein
MGEDRIPDTFFGSGPDIVGLSEIMPENKGEDETKHEKRVKIEVRLFLIREPFG